MGRLTPAEVRRFDTFGYLVLPGLLVDDVDEIMAEFEAAFAAWDVQHDGLSRSTVIPFIDQRPRLHELLEDPRIDGVFTSLLGPDWCYFGSDANLYTGDTRWHPDGTLRHATFVKLAVYLDSVDAGTGALRVIPGSHRVSDDGTAYGDLVRAAPDAAEVWGIPPEKVPCVSLDSDPGDVVVFHQNLVHGSWGGGSARRMFTVNVFAPVATDDEIGELHGKVAFLAQMWLDSAVTDEMVRTATPARRRRLRQVLEHQDHLPALTRAARAEMEAPLWVKRPGQPPGVEPTRS